MIILKNVLILEGENNLVKKDVAISSGKIDKIGDALHACDVPVIDCKEMWLIPAGVDVHVHLREPGFCHKETVKTGTLAAVKGGFGTIMTMPNLNPTPDSVANLKVQLDILATDSLVHCYPFASVTVGEKGEKISDLAELSSYVKGFTDDGVGVNNYEILAEAMDIAGKNNIVIASHAELTGYGTSEKAEYLACEKEIELLRSHPCKYHFCHISTAESFRLISNAKKEGLNVTCEVTPHHLLLNNDNGIPNNNYQMNPPLRSSENVQAAVNALISSTASMIATDHAPHTAEEKNSEKSPNGITGLETALPLIYTHFVKNGLISHKQFIEITSENPATRFNLPFTSIEEGATADLALLDINNSHTFTACEIVSKSSNTPFIGETYFGKNCLTLINGEIVYRNFVD